MSRSLATPVYDELYDCARQLGTVELWLEVREGRGDPEQLWLVLRTADDGRAIHQRRVTTAIEAAARGIRRALERDAQRRGRD